MPALLKQLDAPLASASADGAYDVESVYEAFHNHNEGPPPKVIIPPRKSAQLSPETNTALQERNRHIRSIDRNGRRRWEKTSGYGKRSKVENSIFRYKAIIGTEMKSRTLAGQRVEVRIGCRILNKMTALGMPNSYRID